MSEDKDVSPNKDAILEEYRNIRTEILQLNSQAFTAVTISLTVNTTILGWMFSNHSKYFYLPVIGFIILFSVYLLVLTRDRLAHRLAFFQKFFIEKSLPDIYWARAYPKYRNKFKKIGGAFENCVERLANSNLTVLVTAQVINFFIFGYCAIEPLFYSKCPYIRFDSVTIDLWKVFLFVVMLVIWVMQCFCKTNWTKYTNIKKAMKASSKSFEIEKPKP